VFWCWFIGFYLAFMPLYALGLMGATRRMQHYADPSWQPLMLVALAGAVCILLGIGLTILQLIVSIRDRARHRDYTGDPWNGRTLEWSTSSPPPAWNYATLPLVERTDAFWAAKEQRKEKHLEEAPRHYVPIEVPKNTPAGFFIAFFSVITGFALIWRIWWLAFIGLAGLVLVAIVQGSHLNRETRVPIEEIAALERKHARAVGGA